MENPPDLIVAVRSDDQYYDKKKVLNENNYSKQNEQQDDLLANLQSDKYALECELRQLRTQQSMHHDNEFNEQSYLLKQRFYDEIQYVITHHTELVQHTTNDLTAYVTNVLRKSINDIESLRLLHQKELCIYSNKSTNDCIQHQSDEMIELCHHLINQQFTNPMNLFHKLLDNFQIGLNDLKISFDSKISYLNDIHLSTIEKLNTKHEIEINELKCELNLLSNH